jgi:pteridine reductase
VANRRVALVTGSGRRRVGWHVAQLLGERGYAIALHYRTAEAEAAEAVAELLAKGIDAAAFQADLSREEDANSLIQSVLGRFTGLDVLVNCAAIWRSKRLEEVTASDVREHFDANVLGTFLCARAAGLAMVKQESGGCIVNFGDWAEARPYPNYAAYFASKGAIPTLTRCLAVELGTRNPNVRVNCVLPGPVMLPADLPEAERKEAIDATLVRREGKPENVARAVLALVENDFITGACLPVDGGRTVWAGGR